MTSAGQASRPRGTAVARKVASALGVAVALGFVAVVAACSAGRGASSGAGSSSPAPAARFAALPSGNRAEGDALARELLSRLTLPPGSRRLVAAPASLPPGYPPSSSSADINRQFSLPMPLGSAESFLLAHPPAGVRPDGNGSLSEYDNHEVYFWTWSQRVLPRGISSIALQEEAESTRGGTLVRVDALVVWDPARPAAEFLTPGAVASVTVHVFWLGAAPVRHFSRTISSPTAIAAIAKLFNSLRGTGGVLCPRTQTVYYLDIAAAAGRPGYQVVAANCNSDAIEVAGRDPFDLWDPGDRMSSLLATLTGASP